MGLDAVRGISSWFPISSIWGSRAGFRDGEQLARGGEHTDGTCAVVDVRGVYWGSKQMLLVEGLERKPGNGVMGNRCNLFACAVVALVLSLGVAPPAQVLGCTTDAECEDNNPCTDDRCVGGGVGGPGQCWNISTCADDLTCNGTELCCTTSGGCGPYAQGACVPGTPIVCTGGWVCVEPEGCIPCRDAGDCDDGDPCTLDTCEVDVACHHDGQPGASCDDGNACTIDETCVVDEDTGDLICVGEQFCNDLAPECHVGMCVNPNTGECQFFVGGEGNTCDDQDICTPVDQCQNGVCVGGFVDGCLDLEFRLAGGQTTFNPGDIVEVQLWAMPNGCEPPPETSLCPIGTQAIGSVGAVVSWDPAVFEVWNPDPTVIPCIDDTQCPEGMFCDTFNNVCARNHRLNPEDDCDDLDSCNIDCGLPGQRYNWAGSLYPNDCQAEFPLNEPCTGIPGNDGNLKFLAFAQIRCAGSDAQQACASSTLGGLWVSTLKFKALAATAGISGPSAITLENCLLGTRTKVISGDSTQDIVGALGQPVLVVVECVSDSDCPSGPCIDGECICPPPVVEVQGPRYINVTPQEGTPTVGILVTGLDEASCVSNYVLPDNRLAVNTITFQPPGPEGWGTVHLRSDRIVGNMTYKIQTDCNEQSPGVNLSEAVIVTMSRPGDVDFTGVVDILDVTRELDGFRSIFHTLPCTADADCWQVGPYYTCDRDVGFCIWIRFENVDIIGDTGCTPDRIVSILDVMLDLDYFRSLPNPCRPCP